MSLILVGFVCYFLGKNNSFSTSSLKNSTTTSITPLPTQIEIPSTGPTIVPTDSKSICAKTGPSQPKDYLISYILKEGDSFQKIADEKLGDSTRVSELTTLNQDQRQLTVGSTIYLPPSFIKQSSGHIYEVSGKIVLKDNNANWQLSYGGDPKGPGIVFPGYWFKDIDTSPYQIGDCVTILFDNGVKVYTIKKS